MTPQYAKSYQEYKRDLDTELSKTAEGFVRIGYLLKVARDTDVLTESPYQTVTEFARAEYGIDKTMVSRFISINDRFSEGGYSDSLQEQYRGYGYTKLTLMLSLPEEINQQLSPAYSKAEIQAIKEEVEEEKNISDLEVMMEAPAMATNPTGGNLLDLLIRQLGEDAPELYIQMAKIMKLDGGEWTRAAKETMAPNAEKQYSIRISGIGRFLMSVRDTEDTVTATSLRTVEKHSYDYPALRRAWEEILPPGGNDTDCSKRDYQEVWETIYKQEYPGKGKVAPVQQEKPGNTESKPAPRKESKVQKAPKPKPPTPQPTPEPEKPENTGTEAESGEMVADCHQLEEKPESTGMEAADRPARQPEEASPIPQEPENRINTGTETVFYPGMRVHNVGGAIGHPDASTIGTVIGPGAVPNTWEVQYDGYEVSLLICDSEASEFAKVDWEEPRPGMAVPAEEKENPPGQAQEQLPGQVNLEEAIEEIEKGTTSYIEPDSPRPAAGQDLDTEWENLKKALSLELRLMNMPGAPSNVELSRQDAKNIKRMRKNLINMAALIEQELLRRGESF